MFKNITFSAEEKLILKTKEKAVSEKTTFNVVFRRWFKKYTDRKKDLEIDMVMESVDYAVSGRKFTRDEMNER